MVGATSLAIVKLCCAEEPRAQALAQALQDNSFFIEEAYNQQLGVVQHILSVPLTFDGHQKNISPNLTEEWPVLSELHQFSYTIPYSSLEDNGWDSGFGDIRLNYRLQALKETDRTPAFAPRLTLVIPTDGGGETFGHEEIGYETNLPFSKVVGDSWTMHANAGGSVFPDDHGHTAMNYNLGGSVIYAASKNLNLMLESVEFWEESVSHRGKVDRTFTALISPGARYAFNLPKGAQLVVGAAVPVGISADAPDWGLFFYFSFEHSFTHSKEVAPK
jgi:Putative MetA-pathway of phenol degradation